MRTNILCFCAAMALSVGAAAQDLAAVTEPSAATSPGLTQCLMRSSASTWKGLGLTEEKGKQAQAIADRCTQEHKMNPGGTAGAMKVDDMSETHVQELKNLLTVDEFTKWKDQCGRSDTPMEGSNDKVKGGSKQ